MIPFTLFDTTTGQVLQSGICENPEALENPQRSVLLGERYGDGWIAGGQHHAMPERPSVHHGFDWSTKEWVDTRTEEDIRAAIQKGFVAAIQKRLDDFAKTRNYDNILSACTYATSTVPQFAAEGQHCVELRDATWTAGYALLADVLAGGPVPTTEEVMAAMPVLEWPS